MSAHRRGVSQTPFLIVFIILTFLASLVAYMFSSSLEKQKEETRREKIRANQLKDKYNAKWNEVSKLREITGYYGTEDSGDETETDVEIIRNDLERINRDALPHPAPTKPLTVQIMLKELERSVNTLKQQIREATLERDNMQQRWRDEEKAKREMMREKTQEMQDFRDRAQRAQERLNQEIQQKEGQITELRDRNHSLHADLERSEAEHQARVGELTTDIRTLRSRIDKLVEFEKRKETLIPDGEVIRADIDHGFAYIDLGWKHGVKPGSRFKVYEVLKGGRRKEKGEIRIIRVEKDFSQCSILAMEETTNPIVKGDYIWNKFFERNVKKVFVFIGKFDSEAAKYSKEQLKKIIEENGHIATEVVRNDTDYAVLGEEHTSDPQWRLVQDFKVEKISPRDLLGFFGYGSYRTE
jgi:hypothetical protein